jgi:hypothetical protein
VDAGVALGAVACESATQCTATDRNHEVTFNPVARTRGPLRTVFRTGVGIAGLVCPATHECTAVAISREAFFNPHAFHSPALHIIGPGHGSDATIVGVRCPSRTECVAVDSDGGAVAYNPRSGKVIHRDQNVEKGEALTAIACPSTTQCTATDNDGTFITFQPLTGHKVASAKIDKPVGLDAPSGDSDNELDAVACKGTRLCVAVDTLGNAVRFDPRGHGPGSLKAIDKGRSLSSVACPSTTECLSTDSAGRVLVGNAHTNRWTIEPLPQATPLTSVTCRSTTQCVVVDTTGEAFRSRQG